MKTLIFLVVATFFETYGDAVVRRSLTPFRPGIFLLGAVLLTTYGLLFNKAPIDYGTAAAVYASMVFIAFQIVNYTAFGQAPKLSTYVAGALIVAGELSPTLGGRDCSLAEGF
jgi:multidrug transporter EmrE-like cation transporter